MSKSCLFFGFAVLLHLAIHAAGQAGEPAPAIVKQLALPLYADASKAPASRRSNDAFPFLEKVARQLPTLVGESNRTAPQKELIGYVARAHDAAKRIAAHNASKPSNWDTGTGAATLWEHGNKDRTDQTTFQDLVDANAVFNALYTVGKRGLAEADIYQLRNKARQSAFKIRRLATRMAAAHHASRGRPRMVYQGWDSKPLAGVFLSNDAGRINQVIPGGSADRAGLRVGDKILTVDGERASPDTLISQLRQPLADRGVANLRVERGGKTLPARLYADAPQDPLLKIDYNTQWRSVFSNSSLFLTNNSSRDLSGCVLLVTFYNADASQLARYSHYVPHWKQGAQLCSPYYRDGEFGYREIFDTTQSITVDVLAEGMSTPVRHYYVYAGGERDHDIASYCKNMKLTGRRLPMTEGFISPWNAGMRLTFDGPPSLPPCQVLLTFVDGGKELTRVWTMNKQWTKGWTKTFRDEHFNRMQPDSVRVEFRFATTNYRPSYTFTF